tara:strand:- start:949 stop:1155 length:207 start_codon:yes stop_codon:yes gene_type:complete
MKIILIIVSVFFTLTLNGYTAELKDCSIYSKLNPKYLVCKTANVAKNTINYQNEQWSGVKKKLKNKED